MCTNLEKYIGEKYDGYKCSRNNSGSKGNKWWIRNMG